MYATSNDLVDLVQGDIPQATAQLLLQLASDAVDGEVGASLEELEYTETFEPGDDVSKLWLVPAGWPVDVDTVTEDGTVLTVGDDYTVTGDGALVRAEGSWGDEVEVVYTTGFIDGPPLSTAKRIVLQLASMAAANPQGFDSLSADGVSPSFLVREGTTALAPVTLNTVQKRQLAPWRWRRRLA